MAGYCIGVLDLRKIQRKPRWSFWNKLRQLEKNIPLNGKVAIIIIFIILIPLLLISGVFFSFVHRNSMETEEAARNTSLINVRDSVDTLMKTYEETIDTIYNYPELFRLSERHENFSSGVDTENQFRRALSRIRSARGYIGNVSFVFPDSTRLEDTSGYGSFEVIHAENENRLSEFSEQMHAQKRSVHWEANPSIRKGLGKASYFFSCSKTVRNIYDENQLMGQVVMYISGLAMDDVTALKQTSQDELLVILDSENQLVWYNGDSKLDASLLDGGLLEEFQRLQAGEIHDYHTKSETYCYMYETSSYSGWTFLNVIPMEAVTQQSDVFKLYFAVVMFLVCLFALLCGILINRQMVRPIQAMIVMMDHIDELEKIGQSLSVDRSDEIGGLYRSFEQMGDRIDFLIGQLKEAYSQDKEKEIKLIQSQLNPHFIYNTLESISWVAFDKDLPEVSKALTCLSSILRYSIKHTGALVTFQDELDQLEQYLYIQHFRFEEKFQVRYHIDSKLLQYKTIKFIFQPFVENALLHAFQDRYDHCLIDITMAEDGNDIQIVIQDNGCGIPENQIAQIMGKTSEGIGINNIDKTLRLKFGNQYHLQIQSSPGAGTSVTLKIPKIR
ncbi:sensor histidine kinase [Massiliimalia timonensis]|uniref:histidine kinase n=1 Tax=Massiliimalia timonensis TaxID=1987501 RepID=A0A8J6P747_9FIRM|nr:histidine kinase [Massiliimalia timonensis]MBC8610604.1 sensor histidine kinase [Massiliimalia timonensis]